MKSLNVFKLARNVDYNLKDQMANAGDMNGLGPPNSSFSSIRSSKLTTKKKNPDIYPAHSTYTKVDPDLVLASPERRPNYVLQPPRSPIENVQLEIHDKGGGGEGGGYLEDEGGREGGGARCNGGGVRHEMGGARQEMGGARQEMGGARHEMGGARQEGGGINGGRMPRLINGNQNGGLNGRNMCHYHPPPEVEEEEDPELYRRIVTLAPFLSTAKEPPLELDQGDGSTSSMGGDNQSSSAASTSCITVSTTATTRKESGSCKSVTKTESTISISTFSLELNWVDPKLIRQGREFVRRNFLGVFFAHFIGLAFLLAVRPVAAILLRNGRFHKRAKRNNWHMYLLLFRRLKGWYDQGDLTDLDDPTTTDILKLRRSICSAGRNFRKFVPPPAQELDLDEGECKILAATKEDLQQGLRELNVDMKNIPKIFATINPDVPWSQYDLAIVQFAFFGFISLFPKSFGIHNHKGLQGFIHIWAVIGHLLGLENRFNLCRPENWDEDTNRKIFKHVFLFSFKIADNAMLKMLHLMCDSSQWFTIFITRLKLVLLFMAREVAGLTSTKNMFVLVRWYDRVEYFSYRFWNQVLVRVFFLRICANLCARFVLFLAFAVYLGQVRWRRWRAKRKPPQQIVVFPSSVSLDLSKMTPEGT